MANTYDTSNEPLGSTAVKVLYNNASNLDDAVNSQVNAWVDRPPFNRVRKTIWGMEQDFYAFLAGSQFELPALVYVDGTPLQVDRPTQLILRAGILYSVKLPSAFPVILSGTWATDEPLLTVRNDASLRQELMTVTGADLIGYLQTGRTVYDRLRELPSVTDGGALTSLPNNKTAVEAALTGLNAPSTIYVPQGAFQCSAAPDNPQGIQYDGPGAIMVPAQVLADGYRQFNTYADDNQVGIGREYLNRCFEYLNLGQASPGGTMKVFLYGDSTVQGGHGETTYFNPKRYLERALVNKGIGNATVTNRGIGGSMMEDHVAQAVADLALNPALYIMKSFINEGGLPLATRLLDTAQMLDDWLSAVRSQPTGSLGGLAIVVMGPNSTNNTIFRRDAHWYEQLRGMIIAKCRKYQAAYFDTYQMLQDTLLASTIGYLDQPIPSRPLDGVHPHDTMNAQMWGGMIDWILPDNALYNYRSNNFSNTGSVAGALLPGTLPSEFLTGQTWNAATVAVGWPLDGMVITEKSVDRVTIQRLIPFAPNRTREFIRTADVAADTWNQFTGVLVPLTFSNGWTDYDPTGAAIVTSRAMLTADGLVMVQFAAKNGTIAAGTVMATLPVGMRPASPQSFSCRLSSGSQGLLGVMPNGNINAISAVDAALTHALSMVFRAA